MIQPTYKSVGIILLLIATTFMASCVTTKEKQTTLAIPVEEAVTPTPVATQTAESVEVSNVTLALWPQLLSDYQLQAIEHRNIDKQIQQYARYPKSIELWLERSRPFLFHVQQELRKRNMPGEIALLPVVESNYIPTAYSPYGAAGLWQFMPATGKSFGLKQDWWYDARRDPLASTDAALDYLQQLHKRFDGDWLLAIAAYNAGGGRVSNAIKRNKKKHKPTDFWSLELPRETRNYVPKLLALAKMTSSPAQYNIALPDIEYEQCFAKVDIDGQLDLKVASKLAGIKPKQLLNLNSGFNRWVTHPEGPHRLLLPLDAVQKFQTEYAQMPEKDRIRWERYKIQSGDTLGHIAKKYGLSISSVKKANNLKNSKIRAGKHLMIPLSGTPIHIAAFASTALTKNKIRYRVRKGDSLYRIAHRYNVKIKDLQRWNRLSGSRLRPGQKLVVLVDPSKQTL